jgi:hypothetical protein
MTPYIADMQSKVLESRARRAARRAGYVARKSRRLSIDNYGGFRIIEPRHNFVVAGSRFEMTAQDVIDFCEER